METLSQEYPISQICQTIDLQRSTYYYENKAFENNNQLEKAIEKVVKDFPTYGYRMTAGELRRRGCQASDYKISRLMKKMGLTKAKRRKKCRTTNSNHGYTRYPNLVQGFIIKEIDDIWSSDITYVRLGSEFVYLAVIMDITTRAIRGWSLSRSIDHYLTLEALEKALEKGKPKIHHSDQGVQYSCPAYTDLLEQNGIQISMANVGQAWQNGYCERLVRTIKDDEIDLSDYRDFNDAYINIEHFVEEVYMKKRIHSSLGYLPPAEFEAKCRLEGVKQFVYK